MSEAKNTEQAKAVFNTLCKTLEKEEWHFSKDDENLSITCGAKGEDLKIDIDIQVDSKRSLVLLLSRMPFTVKEDKRLDVAIAISAANNLIVDGCFDYNISNGNIFYRITNSFIDSEIGMADLAYMLYCACGTVDEYNDKFLMVSKGLLSIEKFLEQELK